MKVPRLFILSYVTLYSTIIDEINNYAAAYISIIIGIWLILVWIVPF